MSSVVGEALRDRLTACSLVLPVLDPSVLHLGRHLGIGLGLGVEVIGVITDSVCFAIA